MREACRADRWSPGESGALRIQRMGDQARSVSRRRRSRTRGQRVAAWLAAAVLMAPSAAWCATAGATDQPTGIPASEAAHHVGEVVTVCGRVASAAHIGSVKGRPTFLNFERPYPDQPFSVVIWESARARFDKPPERQFDGKSVCVTGRIETYRGKPQIVVEDPDQIVVTTPASGGGELSNLEGVFVKALLASLGRDVDYGSGEWDQQAVEAVIAFQEASGLEPTGDPDASTLRALAAEVVEMGDADRTLVIRLLLFELARQQD